MMIHQVTFDEESVTVRYNPGGGTDLVTKIIELKIDGMAAPAVITQIDDLLRFLVEEAEEGFEDTTEHGMRTL